MRVGSKTSSQNAIVAEIYAAALERDGVAVERRMNLGDSQSVLAALERGEIDLYPDTVPNGEGLKRSYERRYGITWLTPSPFNDAPCLATSQYAAEKYWLLTLSKCAEIAPELRLGAARSFLARGGPLEQLQKFYRGFKFAEILAYAPGGQYDALGRGEVDVADGFTTDARIAEGQPVVLNDDKGFWPRSHVAPFVRIGVLDAHPGIRSVLNRISAALTNYAVQQLNKREDLLSLQPADLAEQFLDTHAAAHSKGGK